MKTEKTKPRHFLTASFLLLAFGTQTLLGGAQLTGVAYADEKKETPATCAIQLQPANGQVETAKKDLNAAVAQAATAPEVKSIFSLDNPTRTLGHIVPALPLIGSFKDKNRRWFNFVESPFITGIPSTLASVVLTKALFWKLGVLFLGSVKPMPELLNYDTAMRFMEVWLLYNGTQLFRGTVTTDPTIPDNKMEWWKSEKFGLNYWYSAVSYSLGTAYIKPALHSVFGLLNAARPDLFPAPPHITPLDSAHAFGEKVNAFAWPVFSQYMATYFVTPLMFGRWPKKDLQDQLKLVDRTEKLNDEEKKAIKAEREAQAKVLRSAVTDAEGAFNQVKTEKAAWQARFQVWRTWKNAEKELNAYQQNLAPLETYQEMVDARTQRIAKLGATLKEQLAVIEEVEKTPKVLRDSRDCCSWTPAARKLAEELDTAAYKVYQQTIAEREAIAGLDSSTGKNRFRKKFNSLLPKPRVKEATFTQVLRAAKFRAMNTRNSIQEAKSERRWISFLTAQNRVKQGKDLSKLRWSGMYLHKIGVGILVAMGMQTLYWGLRVAIAGDASTKTPTLFQRLSGEQVSERERVLQDVKFAVDESERKVDQLLDVAASGRPEQVEAQFAKSDAEFLKIGQDAVAAAGVVLNANPELERLASVLEQAKKQPGKPVEVSEEMAQQLASMQQAAGEEPFPGLEEMDSPSSEEEALDFEIIDVWAGERP